MSKPNVKKAQAAEDIDLDANPITLSDGTVLDEAGAEKYGREVADRVASSRMVDPQCPLPDGST